MIPQFPNFKILELSDKEDVEKFTLKYPPYSDFNFAGTWSWDVRNQMKISQLNGNYVIRFVSYLTGEPFYTFLGSNNINETAKKLLNLSKGENLKLELKLIPEESVKEIDINVFKIIEDRNNFDYIYDMSELKDYVGKKFDKKRNRFAAFLKNYPNAEAKIISLEDPFIQNSMVKLYEKWLQDKLDHSTGFESHREVIVLKKFFSTASIFNIVSIGVFLNDELIAFSIEELMKTDYVVSHVVKIDNNFIGINEFLMKKKSEILFSLKKRFLNQEQDLGIESLRQAKSRFRPCFFLKKYIVSYS